MSIRRGIRAGYDFASLALRQGGLGALEAYERAYLAKTLVKELRKGSFVIPAGDDDAVRGAFIDHVQTHFVDNGELQVVIDYQPRLLYSARTFARRPHPIESVILYATWSEHWMNAVLVTTALKCGLTEHDAIQMVRETGFRGKLGWLWASFGLPTIPDPHVGRLHFLADIRNEHVHYKWKGQEPDVVYDPARERLALAVRSLGQTARALVELEITGIIGEDIAIADRLFEVSLAPVIREEALNWRPPTDSPEWRDTYIDAATDEREY